MKERKYYFNESCLLRITLAIVFIAAATFRIFNIYYAFSEMNALGLPGFVSFAVILLEIAIATLLLLKYKVRVVAVCCALFVSAGVVWAMIINGAEILSNVKELFVFNANPTDVLLHVIYVFLLILLIFRTENNGNSKKV